MGYVVLERFSQKSIGFVQQMRLSCKELSVEGPKAVRSLRKNWSRTATAEQKQKFHATEMRDLGGKVNAAKL